MNLCRLFARHLIPHRGFFFTSFESVSKDDIKSMTTLAFYAGKVAAFNDIKDMLKN